MRSPAHEYRTKNDDRKRLPKGFRDSLSFHLSETKEGSFVAQIAVVDPSYHLFAEASPHLPYLNSAIAQLSRLYSAEPPDVSQLPQSAWAPLEKFGRGLREDEAIDFETLQGQERVRVTRESRQRLLLSRRDTHEFTQEFEFVCRLSYVEPENRKLIIKLNGEQTLEVKVEPDDWEDFQDLRVRDLGETWLRVQGIGLFTSSQSKASPKIMSVETLKSVDFLASSDPRIRLEKLKERIPDVS